MLIIVFKCRLCLWTTRLRVEVRDTQNREVVVLCVFMCVGCCNTYSSRSWRAAPDVAQVEMREQLPPECPSESANRPSRSPSVTDCLSCFFFHITPDRLFPLPCLIFVPLVSTYSSLRHTSLSFPILT